MAVESESTQDLSAAERFRSIAKSYDYIGNQTRDIWVCSIVPQPITLPNAPKIRQLEDEKKQIRWL
jgi:hypothetical protein